MARDDFDDDRRPDPDALLALSGRHGRGKLRVFLGAAPGVGKTYAMLARARAARADGVDIVVGLAETHGRQETMALMEGLEVLARHKTEHRGRSIEEFDLDAALKRKPKIFIVDELAHSNAPDSRHPKRWQDVEELLGAGIDVWTALNIQHLESLADVVSRITGVNVRETVPDRVLRDACDVILVDITPDELLQRLEEGKVYVPETAMRAMRNFFTPRNLTALRELAMRSAADRVDDQMVDFLRQGAIQGPWGTSERLLVCVGRDAFSETLVRAAARLATSLNASWIALHVRREDDEERESAEIVKGVDNALRLAERLGARIERLFGADLPGEILRFARQENVTQIVLGRSKASALTRLLRRSFTDEIVRRSADIAVHVVVDEAASAPSPPKRGWLRSTPRAVLGLSAAVATVAITIGAASLLERWLPQPNLSVVFIVPVVVCAATLGRFSAIAASILSFFAYDYFFIDPRYDLTISEPQEFLALLVFLVVANITGTLASRLREYSQSMRRRAETSQALFDFSKKLSAAASSDELLWAATTQIQKIIAARAVVVLTPGDGDLTVCAAWPPLDRLDTGENGAARWALEKNEAAGWRTGTLPNVRFQFRPLATTRGVVGVCGFEPKTRGATLTAQDENMLTSLLEQTAMAIDRSLLIADSVKAAALEENEKLRTTLLASLSHDLRTPLASITGAVTSLQQLGDKMPPEDRQDLLASIEEESARLARFIANLLDMSRIEAGGLAPRRDLVDVGAVVRSVLERARKTFPQQIITTSVAPDLPEIRGDVGLLSQVLFNLIDNAQKYGGLNTSIHARREGDEVVLTVTDEGPGVKQSDLERIFEKFYRGGRPDGRKAGTGLGLSICRGLVEAMGGRIVAQSPAVRRRGLRILMRFPSVERKEAAA